MGRREHLDRRKNSIDTDPGSARNLKLVQPGGTRDWLRRKDPEMRLTVLCVYIVIPRTQITPGQEVV